MTMLLCAFAASSFAQVWATTPSTQPDIPAGEGARYSFSQSTLFPGTVRDYWIYVPREYRADKPACLVVDQDDVQFHAPAVFDRLIHDGQMPATIGVFVAPGKVKAISPAACGERLYMRKTKVVGNRPFDAPIKPKPPKL
jgi:gluconolactonase